MTDFPAKSGVSSRAEPIIATMVQQFDTLRLIQPADRIPWSPMYVSWAVDDGGYVERLHAAAVMSHEAAAEPYLLGDDDRHGITAMWLASYKPDEVLLIEAARAPQVIDDRVVDAEVCRIRYSHRGYIGCIMADLYCRPGLPVWNPGGQVELLWLRDEDTSTWQTRLMHDIVNDPPAVRPPLGLLTSIGVSTSDLGARKF